MKTLHRATAVSALLLAAGCASAPAKPPYAAFETIAVPKGLQYLPGDSTIIETTDVKAGRVVYRGRLEPETLAASIRSSLEADGWKLLGGTASRSGATQIYDKAGTQLQVRIWEGGPFSWYTYVELAAVETMAGRPRVGSPAPGATPAPRPSASAIPDAPAPVVTR
jgi:hypothetical protein